MILSVSLDAKARRAGLSSVGLLVSDFGSKEGANGTGHVVSIINQRNELPFVECGAGVRDPRSHEVADPQRRFRR